MNKQAENLLIAYPEYDKRIERDYMYDVKVVQGDRSVDLVCYNHCDSVITSPRTVNGDMPSISATLSAVRITGSLSHVVGGTFLVFGIWCFLYY